MRKFARRVSAESCGSASEHTPGSARTGIDRAGHGAPAEVLQHGDGNGTAKQSAGVLLTALRSRCLRRTSELLLCPDLSVPVLAAPREEQAENQQPEQQEQAKNQHQPEQKEQAENQHQPEQKEQAENQRATGRTGGCWSTRFRRMVCCAGRRRTSISPSRRNQQWVLVDPISTNGVLRGQQQEQEPQKAQGCESNSRAPEPDRPAFGDLQAHGEQQAHGCESNSRGPARDRPAFGILQDLSKSSSATQA